MNQIEQIGEVLRAEPHTADLEENIWDGKTLSEITAKTYQVDLSVRQCQLIFGQLGSRSRKPRPQIAQADPELQEVLKKTKKRAANDNLDIWVLDEVHFQQHGSNAKMWFPPEVKDPLLLHHPTRIRIGCFLCSRIGQSPDQIA
jgi:hypothetical protein